MLTATYDVRLVVLSLLIVTAASYTAREMAGLIRAAKLRQPHLL